MRSALWALVATAFVFGLPAPAVADDGDAGADQGLEERVRALEEAVAAKPDGSLGRVMGNLGDLLRPDRDYDGEGGLAGVEIHGGINVGWADMDKGWAQTGFLNGPANVWIPNTDHTSMTTSIVWGFDAPVSENVGAHFRQMIMNDGNATRNDVIAISWKLCDPATLTAGRFWSPFGIVNQYWDPHQAYFQMLPNASTVLPPRFVDTGARFDGKLDLGGMGLIYTAAFTNGAQSMTAENLPGGIDNGQNKTFTARGGLILVDTEEAYVEAGASWLDGELRDDSATSGGLGTATGHAAELQAFGVDLQATLGPVDLRGYWATSTETFGETNAPIVADLDREGLLLEGSMMIIPELPVLGELRAKGRFDQGEIGTFATNSPTRRKTVIAYGFSCHPEDHFTVGAEYYTQNESGTDSTFASVKDDGYTVSATVEF